MSLRPNVITARDAQNNPSLEEDKYLAKIIKYIPAEIVAAYVSLRGFLIDDQLIQEGDQYFGLIFFGMLFITPFYTYFFAKDANKPKPFFHAIVAMVSFAFWVFALGDYFQIQFPDYSHVLASILLVFVTLIIPLLELVFLPPTSKSNKTA